MNNMCNNNGKANASQLLMKIIISPAKSLDFTTKPQVADFTNPQFLEKTERLHKVLKTKSAKSIAKLMDLSEKLSELNRQRYQDFNQPSAPLKQAVFVFSGDVYLGLDAYSLGQSQTQILQDNVRILSGFYGLLKPLDNIQAHRLEMGTKLKIGRADNLYQFWGKTVTKELSESLQKDEPLVNLASKEYFQVIQKKQIANSIVTPAFYDWKNGKYKIISFFAKKARGMMTRFVLDKKIEELEGLKSFDYGGYQFSSKNSTLEKFIFQRKGA
jgi:cytoplasmic iron level regulating protein YaaA (DUF328/UPF0246 family)